MCTCRSTDTRCNLYLAAGRTEWFTCINLPHLHKWWSLCHCGGMQENVKDQSVTIETAMKVCRNSIVTEMPHVFTSSAASDDSAHVLLRPESE